MKNTMITQLATFITCAFATLNWVALGDEETAVQRGRLSSEREVALAVKAAIESGERLPVSETNYLRNTVGLDIQALARKWSLVAQREEVTTNETTSMELLHFAHYPTTNNVRKGAFQMRLITSKNPEDARQCLFEYMGVSSTMMITPGRWKLYKQGPGDFCLTGGERVSAVGGDPTLRSNVQFVRDNVAVYLLGGSGRINLLSVARDLDEAIKKCPLMKSGDPSAPNGGSTTRDAPAGTTGVEQTNAPPTNPVP